MGGQHYPRTSRDPSQVARRAELERTSEELHKELAGTGKTYGDVGRLIYHYRQTGSSWAKISDLLEQDHQIKMALGGIATLYRNYTRVIAAEVGFEERDQLMAMEADRLDALQEAVWQDATNGDLKAVDAVLKIMNQRAKYFGLDQPSGADKATQMNVLVIGNDKEAFIEALRQGRVAGSSRDDEAVEDEEHL
jgi:ribosomal protein S13